MVSIGRSKSVVIDSDAARNGGLVSAYAEGAEFKGLLRE